MKYKQVMKGERNMKKWILRMVLLLLVIIGIVGGVFVYNGHQVYQDAINAVSLSDKVDKIQKDENYIKLEDLPKDYKDAVISVEDRRYYNHGPIDLIGISRAIFTNLKNQQFLEGGSTISQQVAKNLYFVSPNENAALRKVAEVFMANDLEKAYGKDTVLELYVNTIYFGDGYYGIQEASQGYLKKDAKDLTLFDATMMAGIPNAPSAYAPTVNMDLALSRQRKDIYTKVENKYISQEQADKLIKQQDDFKLPKK